MSVTTPLMGLIQPTINVDSGLTWEQSANANAAVIDQHNHTPGSGSQIPPSGIDINAALPFNNNSAISLQSTVFQAQSSLSTLLALYAIGNDLYFNDGASNVIRVTSGGTVNATSSGISSGTASASFVTSVLVVNSASNTPANIQAGSILLGNNISGSKFLTLSPPSAMAANYSLTLPALPASTRVLSVDTSGNIAPGVANAIVTSDITDLNVTTAKIADANVTTAKIADASITAAKLAPLNILSSGISSGSATNSTPVTCASIGFTASGRYIRVSLIPDKTNYGDIFVRHTQTGLTGSVTPVCLIIFKRDSTIIGKCDFSQTWSLSDVSGTQLSGQSSLEATTPCSAAWVIDQPAAGTYTYSVSVAFSSIYTGVAGIRNFALFVEEMK